MTQVTKEYVGGVELKIVRYDPSSHDFPDRPAYEDFRDRLSAGEKLVGVEVTLPNSGCLCLTYLNERLLEMHLWPDDNTAHQIWPGRANRRLAEHGLSLDIIAQIVATPTSSAASPPEGNSEYSLPQPSRAVQ